MRYILAFFITAIILSGLNSALVIQDVQSDVIAPGKSGSLSVTVENDLDNNIEAVVLSLDLSNSPFSTIGSSEDNVDEIEDDDSEVFVYTLVANTDAKPGDYNIPYTLTYKGSTSIKKGTFGVKVRAPSILDYSAMLDNPIVSEKSKLSLKIVNKGLGGAQFVNVKIQPDGYTLISENSAYIGKIDSDDYETVTFDVIVKSNPSLLATVEYEDIDGKKFTDNLELPLKSYTQEKAIQLGIKTKSNTSTYIIIIISLVIIWLIIRAIRKRIRKKKSRQNNGG